LFLRNSFTFTGIASENINKGSFVNIWNDGGVTRIRKANATSYDFKADGFILADVINGNSVTINVEEFNDQLNDLVVGSEYFLSDTINGGISLNPPLININGKISQIVGKAISATKLLVFLEYPIELKQN